ncbi:hypothetical protein BKA56DRAFT_626285 [Ilyonectria sp. MPI-CAGE-AT-0026]|nr:hypothetical protein BKA56DRAFT_626285 [Ilyonectria sp. MPI-CAGE-AT-0026]
MTFEYRKSDGCVVYYRVAHSPLLFQDSTPIRLHANNTAKTEGSNGPYVIWTPHPDRNDGSGLIIISTTTKEQLVVNEDAADPEDWKLVDINHWSAYSRSLRIVIIQGEKKLLVGNGGNFGPGYLNSVACAVVSIPT